MEMCKGQVLNLVEKENTTTINPMLDAALGYARSGWPVLPLHTPQPDGCSCGNEDCSVGKHPRTRHGIADATTDQQQIRAWWARWPDANIGILTGSESGLVVVDLDNRDGANGSDNLAELAACLGELPKTLTSITGNGKHLYFQHPGGTVKNSTGRLAYGLDLKADRGYVVGPPSLHADGRRYQWEDATMPVAELPDWLLNRINTKEEEVMLTAQDSEHSPFTESLIIHEGIRNNTLYKLGCALRGQEAKEQDEIADILLDYNKAMCQPPLEPTEVMAIAHSACQHPAAVSTGKSGKRMEQSPLYWFPLNTREWRADPNIMLMDDAQTGWCIRLMVFAWEQQGYLPADMNKLWKIAGAKSKKVFERRCDLVLAAYEDLVIDGRHLLRHSVLADQYVMKKELVAQKIKAARTKSTRPAIPALPHHTSTQEEHA
jgi:hypothetical protein